MKRPFYMVGHNTNSIDEIRDGLKHGLNAFEIDIQKDESDHLYVNHDPVSPAFLIQSGAPVPPQLVPFLIELRRLFDEKGDAPALVIFDCKIDDPNLATRLLEDVRTYLTDDGTRFPVVFSVPFVEVAEKFFPPIRGRLTPREGLMVDQVSDPDKVANHFRNPYVSNACYGDGITTLLGIGVPFGPELAMLMDVAVAYMAISTLRFVYPWVVVQENTIAEMIRIGVSAVMVDSANAPTLVSMLARPEFESTVRRAIRTDDPFAQVSWLLLDVVTTDAYGAGTDANVTFTIKPKSGPPSRTVDGGFRARFERGTSTCVTFPGVSLSPTDIESITVEHDGAGAGPDWSLDSINVRSRGAQKKVAFNVVVSAQTPVTQPV